MLHKIRFANIQCALAICCTCYQTIDCTTLTNLAQHISGNSVTQKSFSQSANCIRCKALERDYIEQFFFPYTVEDLKHTKCYRIALDEKIIMYWFYELIMNTFHMNIT